MTSITRSFGLTTLLPALLLAGCEKKVQPVPPPPPEVEFVSVQQAAVSEYGDWVASLDGDVTVQITPQVTGYLVRQDYKDGAFVRKGQLLFEIDPRPNQALVEQARAQLTQSQAQQSLAQINVNRDTPLVQMRGIAKSTLDTEVGNLNAADASVKSYQAALATAELNLGFTKVYSLIDGVAGVASTQVGNLVTQSTTLTTVSTLNPIRAYFPISEQEYLELSGRIQTGGTMDILRRGVSVPLQLTLADGSIYPKTGRIVLVDRQVDTSTGTIRVAGAFPNAKNLLRPGQYARVRAVTAMNAHAIIVPQRAVTELQGSYQVAVITDDNKIKIQSIVTGSHQGAYWVIKSGVSEGQRVVTEGNDKVRDGMTVKPIADPSIKPFIAGADDNTPSSSSANSAGSK